jgi:hypothetical protein
MKLKPKFYIGIPKKIIVNDLLQVIIIDKLKKRCAAPKEGRFHTGGFDWTGKGNQQSV